MRQEQLHNSPGATATHVYTYNRWISEQPLHSHLDFCINLIKQFDGNKRGKCIFNSVSSLKEENNIVFKTKITVEANVWGLKSLFCFVTIQMWQFQLGSPVCPVDGQIKVFPCTTWQLIPAPGSPLKRIPTGTCTSYSDRFPKGPLTLLKAADLHWNPPETQNSRYGFTGSNLYLHSY